MPRRAPTAFTLLLLSLAVACGGPDGGREAVPQPLAEIAARTLSQVEGSIELDGLGAPVEVLRDAAGVAHIYAESEEDLFFAQGFVAAQDRLWQMEWWRRFGEGRLAEILGPAAVRHDRFARLLRYRGDMHAEWSSYHPRAEGIVTAFTRGVNAYIERVASDPPVEFQAAGVRPEPWSPEVPLLRMAGLAMTGDNLAEIDLALRVAELGAAEANLRDEPEPFRELSVPPGLDVDRIPRDFRQLTLGPSLPEPELLPRFADLLAAATGAISPAYDRLPDDGSNNWVVSGALSATGMPLLANDPHRSLQLPSLRYLVHLVAPGWNVIGSGEPALPGVAIGHNERIAWGLTIVGIDQGDIFVERLNPDDPRQVWHRGAWEDLTAVRETIEVFGAPAQELELEFSHHGPILHKDLDHGLAYAFRTVLSEPGTAGYLGSLRVDQSQNWDDYREAMAAWKVPSENMIYADVDGNIGWVAAGLAPRRDGWSGRLPVPAWEGAEWTGFRSVDELPQEYNPERGFIATANHNIMPPGYEPPLGYSWAYPFRYERIVEVLSRGGPFTVADFRRLQFDLLSRPALRQIDRLRELVFEDRQAERARRMLVEWDGVLTVDSAAGALFKAWESALEELDPAGEATDDPSARRREGALKAAVERLEREQGPEWGSWRWGRGRELTFEHPFIAAFDAGTVERPGDGTTVNIGGLAHGASFREVIDLSDWDRSVATSTPGQSGQPMSPHYDDLRAGWASGDYFALPYSREAVERATSHRLRLLPAGVAAR